ncbi:MAG TPA: TIGR04282 family arsenosugar biosynthesis glycosyltransferase [Burkholderiaceae bacterium]
MTRCALIVFAKAPHPGHAKTRLIAALGARGAAALAERMMSAALGQALAADIGPVELCVTPDRTHPAFVRATRQGAVTLGDQGGGDLGERMARAFDRVLATHDRALLIGTDAPALDAAYLRAADAALNDFDAVLGPAADGGYTLIGLRRPAPGLFTGMQWSHGEVLAHTRERLQALGLRHVELPVLNDIDEPADLVHVPASWWQVHHGAAAPLS